MTQELKTILETVTSVGVEEICISPSEEEGKLLLRGANREGSLVVFDEVDIEPFTKEPIGIGSVNSLLSKLNLFDNTATVSFEAKNGKYVSTVSIKQGRKKVSFRCSNPEQLRIPKKIPPMEMDKKIVLDKDYTKHLLTAFNAMSFTVRKKELMTSISARDGQATFCINTSESDAFEDEFSVEFQGSYSEVSWNAQPFSLALRESLRGSGDKESVFYLTQIGVIVFDIGGIHVMIPNSVRQ